jgi:hypothetical protein
MTVDTGDTKHFALCFMFSVCIFSLSNNITDSKYDFEEGKELNDF